MKLLIQYLIKYKTQVFTALILAIIYQTFSLLTPFLIANKIIDPFVDKIQYFKENGLENEFIRGIRTGMLLIIGSSTIVWMSVIIQDYFLRIVIRKFGADLYKDVQEHTLKLSYTEFEKQSSGEILSKLQNAKTDSETFIRDFVDVLLTACVGIIVAIVISIKLSLILPAFYLLGVGGILLLSFLLSKNIKLIQKKILNEITALSGTVTESFRNAELVKSLGMVNHEKVRLNKLIDDILDKELRKAKNIFQVNFKQYGFNNIIHMGYILVLIVMIYNDKISIGEFFMLQWYYYYIFGPIESLGGVVISYRQAQASLHNIEDILSKPIEQPPFDPREIERLEKLAFENVRFQYDSVNEVTLDDISFEVKFGENIAFVGSSGSGKTTLVKLLLGLYEPNGGNIYYNGVCYKSLNFNQLRRQVGLVTQNTQLFFWINQGKHSLSQTLQLQMK